MKHLTIVCVLGVASLVLSCSKKNDPAANSDPLLGHWEAESIQETYLTSTGQIQSQMTTQQFKSVLDMKESSYDRTTHPVNKTGVMVHFEYRRVGDTLKLTANIGTFKNVIIRKLDATSLTLEEQGNSGGSSTYIDYIQQTYYHR
ncbi:hypothetical protein [Hymenobacter baengnokdamensis]|uniref:hypothetical protein n=1 Tax=Hymenobacter baengnokdamensis TaxID=2615203 RepID=UPI001246D8F2|nr:hypothetical protein [Hymenobacter baengnokdamensis]